MPTLKMKYGIDLGTTNSSLCKFENGNLTLIKTDTMKETMPSCVSFVKKNAIRVGDSAYNDLRAERARATKKWTKKNENVFIEFKRTMGLDTKYNVENTNRSYSSEELSAEVLKNLLGFVNTEKITACVITIPAKFKSDQIAATKRAADLAGIKHCELLQEPIAAAIAYGLKAEEKNGKWLVFDFGGGTFDVALLSVQDGILQVKDTEGDNYLGGKNLDYAIVDQILIPAIQKNNSINRLLSKPYTASILRESLKFYAENAKNELSSAKSCDVTSQLDEFGNDDNRNEIELDLTITEEDLRPVIEPFFQKAIDICKKLLERNNLSGEQIDSLILVGGPTNSEILRSMLRAQITPNVNTSINPMTAVALGSALFASTIDYTEDSSALPKAEQAISLDVSYEASTVETIEYVTIKPLPDQTTGKIPSDITVEIMRSDKAWSSGKIALGEKGEVFECLLLEGKANSFTIHAFDGSGTPIPSYPNEISILQGTKIVNAVLPYYIGVEVTNYEKEKDVFVSLNGLEKNVLLPATGSIRSLHTPNEIRPGNKSDRLILPIYQGEYDANGTIAMYNDHVFDVVITGNDVSSHIDNLSEFDVVIKVDRSQMMTMEVLFHDTGEMIEKPIEVSARKSVNAKFIDKFYNEAQAKLNALQANDLISSEELEDAVKNLSDIKSRLASEKLAEDGRMHLLADLRRTFLVMDKLDDKYSFEPKLKELKDLLDNIIEANNELENEWDNEVENAKKQFEIVQAKRDMRLLNQTFNNFKDLYFDIAYSFHLVQFIVDNYTSFTPSKWRDPKKAKATLAEAYKLIINSEGLPEVSELNKYLDILLNLIIASEREKAISFKYT